MKTFFLSEKGSNPNQLSKIKPKINVFSTLYVGLMNKTFMYF